MGNLLGAPVTEKETHSGATSDGIPFAVSSMQGWRVHMEDAHITEGRIYAAEAITGNAGEVTYKKIDLPGHALFAVFDGHGGSFAALYAGRNLCRVLSRQPKFVEYAKFEKERPEKEKTLTTSAERAAFIQKGHKLLQEALCNAFVELDKEIALALKGTKVADADQPYHEGPEHNSGNHDPNNTDMDTSDTAGETSPADAALRLLEGEGDSGTTACIVLLTPEWVVCANAGDSRAVMSKLGNKAVPLSFDHKPDDDQEERRIRSAGGYVAGGRVEGDLAVSRGLGDFRFKQMNVVMAGATDSSADPAMTDDMMQRRFSGKPGDQKVSPVPDILVQNRNAGQDEFFVIACDGIWDVQTNLDAVKYISGLFTEGEANLGLICEEMCDICLAMGSKDNMTVLIVKFEGQKVGEGGGVRARRKQRDTVGTHSSESTGNAPA